MVRVGLAGDSATVLSQALVLGPSVTAEPLCAALRQAGFEPWRPGEGALAGFSEPDRIDDAGQEAMKLLLDAFVKQAGDSTQHFAHLVHPGTSFWGDRAELSKFSQERGLAVVAPPARCQTLFSHPLSLLSLAGDLGVPHVVLSFDLLNSPREIEKHLLDRGVGFPFVLKSVHSDRGHGIQVIRSREDLKTILPLWFEQLRGVYGEIILFAEKYVEAARQIQVPFARLKNGELKIFAWVEGSLQQRYRKLVEFCPPPVEVDSLTYAEVASLVRKMAEATGFVGVGSFEFLLEGETPYLVGGSPRLTPSFLLWEKISSESALSWQLAASGVWPGPASAAPLATSTYRAGVSARIFAEDPVLELPRPGRIDELSQENHWDFANASVHLHWNFREGQTVSALGDGWVGTVTSFGNDAKTAAHALSRMLSSSGGSPTWVAGTLQTNERFLSELLEHPWVRAGIFHSAFVDEEFVPSVEPPIDIWKGLASLVLPWVSERSSPALPNEKWVVADRIQMKLPEVVVEGWQWLEVPDDEGRGVIQSPDRVVRRALIKKLSDSAWQVRFGNWFPVIRRVEAAEDPRIKRLRSLVQGHIVGLRFREGAKVPAGEPLALVRSERWAVPHALPKDCRIVRWRVSADQWVQLGDVIVEVVLS